MGNCCEATYHEAPKRGDKIAGVRGQRPANQSATRNIVRNMNQEQAQARVTVAAKEKPVNNSKDNSVVPQHSPTPVQQISNNIPRNDEKTNNVDEKKDDATEQNLNQVDPKINLESDSNSVELKKNEFIPIKSPSLSEQNKARKFEFLSMLTQTNEYQPVYVDARRRTEIKSTISQDKLVLEHSTEQSSRNSEEVVTTSIKNIEQIKLNQQNQEEKLIDNISNKINEQIQLDKSPEIADTENEAVECNNIFEITNKIKDSDIEEAKLDDVTTINSSPNDKSLFYSTSISETSNTISILSSIDVTEYASSEEGTVGNSATESSENLCSKQDLSTSMTDEESADTKIAREIILEHEITPSGEVVDEKIEEKQTIVENTNNKPAGDAENIVSITTPSVSEIETEQIEENNENESLAVDLKNVIVENLPIKIENVTEIASENINNVSKLIETDSDEVEFESDGENVNEELSNLISNTEEDKNTAHVVHTESFTTPPGEETVVQPREKEICEQTTNSTSYDNIESAIIQEEIHTKVHYESNISEENESTELNSNVDNDISELKIREEESVVEIPKEIDHRNIESAVALNNEEELNIYNEVEKLDLGSTLENEIDDKIIVRVNLTTKEELKIKDQVEKLENGSTAAKEIDDKIIVRVDLTTEEEVKIKDQVERLDRGSTVEKENIATLDEEIQDLPTTPTLQDTNSVNSKSTEGSIEIGDTDKEILVKENKTNTTENKGDKRSDLSPNFEVRDHPSKQVKDDPTVSPKSGISYAAAVRGAKKQ